MNLRKINDSKAKAYIGQQIKALEVKIKGVAGLLSKAPTKELNDLKDKYEKQLKELQDKQGRVADSESLKDLSLFWAGKEDVPFHHVMKKCLEQYDKGMKVETDADIKDRVKTVFSNLFKDLNYYN